MKFTRRNILKYAGSGLAAGAVSGAGWQFRPTIPYDGPSDMPLQQGSGPSLLIVYDSMMGSTGSQAAWIAETAREQGYRTALHRAETAPAPLAYDAIVIGSAIRASAWLEPVIEWVAAHRFEITTRPHWFFQCSMTCAGMLRGNEGAPLTEGQRAELRHDCDSLFRAAPNLAAAKVTFFPGRLDFARMTPILRFGYPFVAGSVMNGDYRDKAAAQSWVADQLV